MFEKTNDEKNLDAAFAASVNDVDVGADGKRKKSGGTKARAPAKQKAGRDEHGDVSMDKTDDQNNSLCGETAGEPAAGRKGQGDAIVRSGDDGSGGATKTRAPTKQRVVAINMATTRQTRPMIRTIPSVVRLLVSPPWGGRDEVMPSYVGVTMEAGVPKSRRPKQRKRF